MLALDSGGHVVQLGEARVVCFHLNTCKTATSKIWGVPSIENGPIGHVDYLRSLILCSTACASPNRGSTSSAVVAPDSSAGFDVVCRELCFQGSGCMSTEVE